MLALLLMAEASFLTAQPRLQRPKVDETTLSQRMQSGIKYFDQGEDTLAMDEFFDVLLHGSPVERPLANDYLNLITQRMNVNGASQPLVRPTVTPPAALPQGRGPTGAPSGAPTAAPSGAPAAGPSLSEKTRSDIEEKIRTNKRAYLDTIKEVDGLRLLMQDSNNPSAIGIPTEFLFSNGNLFRKGSADFLHAFTGLVYSLGAAQVVLLPEGFSIGDSKVLDMRRTMALSSQLLSSGVSPARVRINLLQSQVDLPKAMADFRGIIALFVYNQPLPLKPDHILSEHLGPPISLGIFPDTFRPDLGRGTLIEFSVVEPPVGLKSWRFRILSPGVKGKYSETAPIQQILGTGAVFHQVYWNGRKGYWGEVLPPGRYEVALSATDQKNRTNTMRRWVALESSISSSTTSPAKAKPDRRKHLKVKSKQRPRAQRYLIQKAPESSPTPASASSAAAPEAGSPSTADQGSPISGTREPGQTASSNQGSAPYPAEGTTPSVGTQQSPAPTTQSPDSTESSDAKSGFSYRINFAPDSQSVSQDGEQRLSQAADAMGVYPSAKLNVVGYAGTGEKNPDTLANDRAKTVSSLLIRKYSMDPQRIQLQTKVTDTAKPEVELFIVAGKE